MKSVTNFLTQATFAELEERLLVHIAVLPTDRHLKTASEIFKVPPEQVTVKQRRIAKAINFLRDYNPKGIDGEIHIDY